MLCTYLSPCNERDQVLLLDLQTQCPVSPLHEEVDHTVAVICSAENDGPVHTQSQTLSTREVNTSSPKW